MMETMMTRNAALFSGFGFNLPALSIHRIFSVMGERRRLSELSDAQLEDIGVTRADAMRESAKPFWSLPTR
ncbi:DUF1127 domain-containing protein [Rhodobacteraceae bacterium NNCM2]|nr:DUF1127 domain-containing protein [Coraliihabitans acroporae]